MDGALKDDWGSLKSDLKGELDGNQIDVLEDEPEGTMVEVRLSPDG